MSAFKGLRIIPPNLSNPESFRWTRTGGGATSISYNRGSFAELFQIGASLTDEWDTVDIQKDGDGTGYRMVLSQNADEVQETHEVIGSNLTQSVYISPILKKRLVAVGVVKAQEFLCEIMRVVNKLKSDQITRFDSAVDDLKKVAEGTGYGYVVSPAMLSLITDILKDITLNGDQFLQSNYTYRHTLAYADRIFDTIDFTPKYKNVEKIFTESQLRDAESIPQVFKLPVQVIDNTKTAEWLKQPVHAALTYGQKRSVTVEYLFADTWTRLKYEAFS